MKDNTTLILTNEGNYWKSRGVNVDKLKWMYYLKPYMQWTIESLEVLATEPALQDILALLTDESLDEYAPHFWHAVCNHTMDFIRSPEYRENMAWVYVEEVYKNLILDGHTPKTLKELSWCSNMVSEYLFNCKSNHVDPLSGTHYEILMHSKGNPLLQVGGCWKSIFKMIEHERVSHVTLLGLLRESRHRYFTETLTNWLLETNTHTGGTVQEKQNICRSSPLTSTIGGLALMETICTTDSVTVEQMHKLIELYEYSTEKHRGGWGPVVELIKIITKKNNLQAYMGLNIPIEDLYQTIVLDSKNTRANSQALNKLCIYPMIGM